MDRCLTCGKQMLWKPFYCLDCIVIARTGSGKTMPFGMPLLLDEAKDKIVVIISPLNELKAEQVHILIPGVYSCC
jgi:superfamily II DNA helicase RecQ